MIYVLAFLITFGIEWLWTLYIRRTAHGAAVAAANYNTILGILAGILTLSYISVGWTLLIPVSIASWLSSYLSVRLDKKS